MTRASLTLVSALNLCFGAACLPPNAGTSTDGDEPLVGRLRFNDRVVNLTLETFADEANGVPRDATAKIIADIDLSEHPRGGAKTGARDGLILSGGAPEHGTSDRFR